MLRRLFTSARTHYYVRNFPITASVTGATAYMWSTKEQTQTIQVSSRGIYWAFVNVAAQCEVVDTVEIMYRGNKTWIFVIPLFARAAP
jgi:hypothetical protein